MEVEEENTSNHLHESTTTTVSNESLLENHSNDKETGKEVSEANAQEEKGEESSVIAPKLDDPNSFVAVAVGEAAEEKEVPVQCGNSELGGRGNSVALEYTSVLKDEKDGEGGEVKDEISTDVAAVERGGSKLTSSAKVDGGECEAAVIVRDNGLNVVEENVKNSGEDANTDGSLVIENDKDGGEGEMEIVKVEENDEALKDGGGVDVPLLPVTEIAESEEVGMDVKNDGGVDNQKESVEIVQGDEAITEDQDDFQKGMDAEVLKEEAIVAAEEDAIGVGEGIKEEGKMADEEKTVGVTENDEEEPMVADEEKSLDTETDEEATMANEEKVPDAEAMETELLESSTKSTAGKRKRGGRNSKTTPRSMGKMIEEDVCFICFDGGDLVLCDRRNCPKAYHPSCVNRDEAFFQTKGRWNCAVGWCQWTGDSSENLPEHSS